MRKEISTCLVLCGYLLVPTRTTDPGQRPIPPGVRQADKASNAPIEAPAAPPAKVLNPEVLRQEAAELARLSASIPSQINLVSQGQLPKALPDQLKRIEKLAKHLRSEITK